MKVEKNQVESSNVPSADDIRGKDGETMQQTDEHGHEDSGWFYFRASAKKGDPENSTTGGLGPRFTVACSS